MPTLQADINKVFSKLVQKDMVVSKALRKGHQDTAINRVADDRLWMNKQSNLVPFQYEDYTKPLCRDWWRDVEVEISYHVSHLLVILQK